MNPYRDPPPKQDEPSLVGETTYMTHKTIGADFALNNRALSTDSPWTVGAKEERARIVAYLRRMDWNNTQDWDGDDFKDLIDRIERGES